MLEDFLNYLEKNSLAEKSERILLAVSGGIDSMVMADLFSKTGYFIGIAHCNFRLRGTDSDNDELFVKEYAARLNKPFFSIGFNTAEYAREKGISTEMAARELRYRWFEEIRSKHGYDKIALAHNKNDNVETILLNLCRGTGIKGLTGMKPLNGNLIRPLLFASRSQIQNYASENSIEYRLDVTNDEVKFIRNKFRHQIIPLFREINPSFDDTVTEMAERFSELREILENHIRTIKQNVVIKENGETVLSLKKLLEYSPQKTILFELFQPYGLLAGQLETLIKVINGQTGSLIFTETHRIIKNRDEIIITKLPVLRSIEFYIRNIEDFYRFPFIESAELKPVTSGFRIEHDPLVATIDASLLEFPLKIRNWKAGDRFMPFGMESFRKLSDYFTDRKFSLPDKEKALVMESAGKIVWLLGERIDNRFRITLATRNALIIRLRKNFKDF
ncbi:MAG: tRNA lysidine(34) synthetase TilS [Bacteroidales bacterium]